MIHSNLFEPAPSLATSVEHVFRSQAAHHRDLVDRNVVDNPPDANWLQPLPLHYCKYAAAVGIPRLSDRLLQQMRFAHHRGSSIFRIDYDVPSYSKDVGFGKPGHKRGLKLT